MTALALEVPQPGEPPSPIIPDTPGTPAEPVTPAVPPEPATPAEPPPGAPEVPTEPSSAGRAPRPERRAPWAPAGGPMTPPGAHGGRMRRCPAASAAPRFHPGPPAGPGADADRAPRSARATRRRPPRRRFVRAIRSRPPGADPPSLGLHGLRPVQRRRRARRLGGGPGRLDRPVFYAVVDVATGAAAGVVSFLRITPEHGVIEIGHVWFGAALQRTPQATEAIFLWPATRSTTSAIAGWSGSAMRPTLAPGPPPSASASPSRASSASTWWSRAATATRPGFRSSTASGRRCATRSRHGWHRRTSTPTPPAPVAGRPALTASSPARCGQTDASRAHSRAHAPFDLDRRHQLRARHRPGEALQRSEPQDGSLQPAQQEDRIAHPAAARRRVAGEEVAYEDLVKGYEISPDRYVVIDPSSLTPSSRAGPRRSKSRTSSTSTTSIRSSTTTRTTWRRPPAGPSRTGSCSRRCARRARWRSPRS